MKVKSTVLYVYGKTYLNGVVAVPDKGSQVYCDANLFSQKSLKLDDITKARFMSEQVKNNDFVKHQFVSNKKHVPIPFVKNGPDMSAGVYILYGRAGSGKSRLGAYIANSFEKVVGPSEVGYYSVGEPEGHSLPSGALTFTSVLDHTIKNHTVSVIDSVKDLFLQWPGPLTSGGISKTPATFVTSLARAAARMNKIIILVSNPVTRKEEGYQEFHEIMFGAATGVISPTKTDMLNGKLSITMRPDNRGDILYDLNDDWNGGTVSRVSNNFGRIAEVFDDLTNGFDNSHINTNRRP